MTKILIIDDEPSIRTIVKLNLEAKDYEVVEADTAESGLKKVAAVQPQLVVLDLGLPDQNGIDVLKALRTWSTVPVVILTVTDDEMTKVALLEAGADDYITKPFSVPELVARIKVALRHDQPDGATPLFESGDLQVDLPKRHVSVKGKAVKLTATEFEVLRILIRGGGQVVAQDLLLREIWGPNAIHNPHYLRIYIGQLRKKIEKDSAHPKHVLTEPGVGYRIA